MGTAMAMTGFFAEHLARHWWVLMLRGVLAIIFGVITFTRPIYTLRTLVLLFGLYSFIDGLLGVWSALSNRHDTKDWRLMLIGGLAGMAIGVVTLFAPRITAFALVLYIAIWAITTGVVEIAMAVRLRREIQDEWLIAIAGATSIAVGLVLLSRPHAGVVAFAWLIAAYAIVLGFSLIGLSLEVRSFAKPRAAAR